MFYSNVLLPSVFAVQRKNDAPIFVHVYKIGSMNECSQMHILQEIKYGNLNRRQKWTVMVETNTIYIVLHGYFMYKHVLLTLTKYVEQIGIFELEYLP